MLWYDGSLKCFEDQNLYDWGGGGWLDRRIIDFDYLKEHNKCKKQIDMVLSKTDKDITKILVTHCVPHIDMNGHARNSLFNAYSGVENLLENRKIDYSISGHTHYRVMGVTREGCDCINVGNDYYSPHEYHLLEI